MACVIVFAIGASTAWAMEDTLKVEDGQTIFEALKGYFAEGSNVTQDEVMGWIGGRCFTAESENTPIASILVTESKLVGDDNGPLFPPKNEIKMIALSNKESANYFDVDNFNSLKDSIVKDQYNYYFDSLTLLTNRNGYLVSQYDDGNLEYRVRQAKGYFILIGVMLREDEDYKAGDVVGACYYFSKVK